MRYSLAFSLIATVGFLSHPAKADTCGDYTCGPNEDYMGCPIDCAQPWPLPYEYPDGGYAYPEYPSADGGYAYPGYPSMDGGYIYPYPYPYMDGGAPYPYPYPDGGFVPESHLDGGAPPADSTEPTAVDAGAELPTEGDDTLAATTSPAEPVDGGPSSGNADAAIVTEATSPVSSVDTTLDSLDVVSTPAPDTTTAAAESTADVPTSDTTAPTATDTIGAQSSEAVESPQDAYDAGADAGFYEGSGDDGCDCRVTGRSQSSGSGLAGFALVGLALARLRRRRTPRVST